MLDLRKLEKVWHVLAFLLLLGAFVPLWRRRVVGDLDALLSDPVQQIFLAIPYFGVLGLLTQTRISTAVLRKSWLLWLVLCWSLISSVWSAAPGLTLRRWASLLLGTLYSLLLASRYSFREVFQLASYALGIAILASLIAVWLLPDIGVMEDIHPGAWRGIFVHKNTFGLMLAASSIFVAVLWREKRGLSKFVLSIVMLILFVALIGSKSATAILAVLCVCASWLLIRILSRVNYASRLAVILFVLVAASITILVLLNHIDSIVRFIGRDTSFTGRLPLWEFLIRLILSERPLLGNGYGAFWQGEKGPSSEVWALFEWKPTHAHNGYIDLTLEIGFVGLFLVQAVLLQILHSSGIALLKRFSTIHEFTLLFFVFLFVVNLSESFLLESSLGKAFYWIIFSYIYFIQRDRRYLQV